MVNGSRQRFAILVTAQGVIDVREGDAVGAEYRVARIEDNAIELAAADGTTRRLLLRP
jgi:Tfp pilus assembly protein PilP